MAGMYGTIINCKKSRSKRMLAFMRDADTKQWPILPYKMSKAEYKQIQKDEIAIGETK